jgi:hypothetical protein
MKHILFICSALLLSFTQVQAKPYIKKSNKAQYGGSGWTTHLKKINNTTPSACQKACDRMSQCSFISYNRTGMVLVHKKLRGGRLTIRSRECNLFSGKPWYGSAPQADSYEKPKQTTITQQPKVTQVKAFKGSKCPTGWQHAPYEWVKKNTNKACRASGMGAWHIARIAGGGSQDGSGYRCKNRSKDTRRLGHSLCVQYEGAQSITQVKAFSGQTCPSGWRHAPYEWVKKNTSKACRASGMGAWHIARIAGGGSQDGSGYRCKNRSRDTRRLGHSLCVR